jgi:hypothetical protein
MYVVCLLDLDAFGDEVNGRPPKGLSVGSPLMFCLNLLSNHHPQHRVVY